MKKKLIALFLAAVMCMSMCISAHAYATFGYYLKGFWGDDYYYVDDRSDGYGALVDDAISAWNGAVDVDGYYILDIDLTETTDGDARTTRVVVSPLDRGATGWAGFAYYYDVSLLGEWSCINYGDYPDQNYQAGSAVINRYYTDGYSDVRTQNVIMHEIGHIFGLAHSSKSTDNGSLMYDGIASIYKLREPQADDVAGIRAVYE